MRRMRKRIIAFLLAVIMVFTTGCSSGFYADELHELSLEDNSVSGNNVDSDSDLDSTMPNNTGEENGTDEDLVFNSEMNNTSITENDASVNINEHTIVTDGENEIEGLSSGEEDLLRELGYIDSDVDEDLIYQEYTLLSDGSYQYHLDPNDEESIDKWFELYMPNSAFDVYDQNDEWFNNLTNYERFFVELLTSDVYIDPNIYEDQTLDECINIIQSGTDADYFFYGSILEGITLEDLITIKEAGYSIEDLVDVICGSLWNLDSDLLKKYGIESRESYDSSKIPNVLLSIAKGTYIYQEAIAKSQSASSKKSMLRAAPRKTMKVHPQLADTGYRAGNGHGTIWRITLGGKPALCMDYGKSCSRNFTYTGGNGYVAGQTLGYFVMRSNSSSKMVTACAQVALWIYLGAVTSGGLNQTKATVEKATERMFLNVNKNELTSLQAMVWSVYHGAKTNTKVYKAYTWYSDNPNAQRLLTYELPEEDIDEPPSGGEGGGTPVIPPERPIPPQEDDDIVSGEIMGDYFCDTELKTTIVTTKRDIETGKPLEGVDFKLSGDFGGYYTTDSNGQFSTTNEDYFSETMVWGVEKGDHEVKVGEDSHGNDIKETKYYYTCKECGQSGDYDSEGSRDEAGEQHCVNHSKEIAEARLNAKVSAYTFRWVVSETDPRTSTHTYNLVTGGTDSYTTGYHNNPVITQSNTESGYHRDEHRVINVNLTNERVRGTITINKSDMDYLNCRTEGDNNQDFIPQGDASLAGAVYGLYANADIIRPDGKSGVDRTGLPTNIRMDYCTGSVDDPNAHKTYTGKNPFGIDAIHT